MRKGALVLGAVLVIGGLVFLYLDEDAQAQPAVDPTPMASTTGGSYQGTLVGLSTPVLSVNSPTTENVVDLDVEEGTGALELTLTVDLVDTPSVASPVDLPATLPADPDPPAPGGLVEVDMLIAAPDCAMNTGCETTVATDDGQVTTIIDAPAPGQWTVRFFHHPPSGGIAHWTLDATHVQAG